MNSLSVAIVGATGLVGETMLRVLESRKVPVTTLIPIASAASSDRTVPFHGDAVPVRVLEAGVFDGVDIALFSAGSAVSREFAPVAAAAGALVVDNSSAWRMEPDVPLVVPEVNGARIPEGQGIVANPNCSTIQMVMVLDPLHRAFGVTRVVAATYQAVTGSGRTAVAQLEAELAGQPVSDPAYPHPIAFNCLPHIDTFLADGYTREEVKMIRETRKIMDLPDLPVTATCVRVPVLGGHSEALNIALARPFTLAAVREALAAMPGVTLVDDPAAARYPMPRDARHRDAVFAGRLRRDPSQPNGIDLWVVADNLRKGAATNAVQIAEHWLKRREAGR